MSNDLKEYVFRQKPKPFRQEPYYCATGDFLSFFWKNEDHYAHRVDDLVTVYISRESKQPVGCKVKGVRSVIMDKVGMFFNHDKRIKLSYLILAGKAMSHESFEDEDEVFRKVGHATSGVDVDLEELCCV